MQSVAVLLIAGSATDREVFAGLIHQVGWANITLQCAESLVRASALLQTHGYDILVLDRSVPEGEEREVLAAIRAINNRVPIIMLTGHHAADTNFSSHGLSVDAILTTGEYGAEELSQAIHRALYPGRGIEGSCSPIDGPELLTQPDRNLIANPAEGISYPSANEQERVLYAAAVTTSYNPIFIADTRGMILYVNPAFERVTGFCQEEASGANPGVLLHEEEGENFFGRMQPALESGLAWKGHMSCRKKGGEMLCMEATTSCFRDKEGCITHYVVVTRDVTDYAELQRQLNQSMRLNSIGQLAGGIAHDFNNILQAIMSYSAFLMEETRAGNANHYEYACGIHDAGMRAANLTRQLLAFGRKQTLQTEVLDLNDLVTGATNLLSRLIGEDIELVLELDSSIPPVNGDPSQMEQIVMNLCVNARDAMPNGGKISIRSEQTTVNRELCDEFLLSPDKPYVLLTVSDTGHGMPPEVLECIFEALFTTKEEGKGFGVGLASVYGIVRRHKGAICCHSTVGAGTVFEIYFPAASESVVAPSPVTEEPPIDVATHESVHSQRILVAEDDPVVASLARTLLEGAGYTVTVALDGETAYREILMANESFALVLSDVVMPRGGGAELLDTVMSAAEISPKPFFLLSSGYSAGILDKKNLDETHFRYLQKPYSPATLLTTVREILQSS